ARKFCWVAHASRVLAMAPSPSRTFPLLSPHALRSLQRKACFGATPKPTRQRRALPGNRWLSAYHARAAFSAFRQIGVEEAEHVRTLDGADAFLLLQIGNALAELFHLRPMHLRPEMVLGVIAVVKEKPVIDFSVAAHTPRNRLVRVRAVMTVIAVQIAEAVAEIPKRHKIKNHVTPIEEKHHEERGGERREFDIAPEKIAISALAQLAFD